METINLLISAIRTCDNIEEAYAIEDAIAAICEMRGIENPRAPKEWVPNPFLMCNDEGC